MQRRFCWLLILFAVASPPHSGVAQKTPPPAQWQSSSEIRDGTLRVDVDLVQVDAIVTDRRGRYVTDLSADDFELYQNGVKQRITYFSYVELQPSSGPSQNGAPALPRPGTVTPLIRTEPTQVRRTMALVIDDLSLARIRCWDTRWKKLKSGNLGSFYLNQAFVAIHEIKQALTKFVDTQMRPGDLVAILRTASNVGVLQQFTSDKRLLYAAIKPIGLPNLSCPESNVDDLPHARDPAGLLSASEWLEAASDTYFRNASLAVLRYVLEGMRGLPGHKSLVLLSVPSGIAEETSPLGRLVSDAALRASATIYEIDPRGLVATIGGSLFRADTSNTSVEAIMAQSQEPGLNFDTEVRPSSWPNQTGGLTLNTNDITRSMGRILADQQGFYLIGYQPEETSFKTQDGKPQFNSLLLKVKRRGLVVRTRSGFFGVEKTKAEVDKASPATPLMKALQLPFASNHIPLKLTCLVGLSPNSGPYIHSLIHVDLENLPLLDLAGGTKKATLEAMAGTFDMNGDAVDVQAKSFNLPIAGDASDPIRHNGLNLILDVPITYQFRVAIRDPDSGFIGSASQLIEVPDIAKGRFALSGILLEGEASLSPKDPTRKTDSAFPASARKFHAGMNLTYQLCVYNATSTPGGTPQLDIKIQLFKDGKECDSGKLAPRSLPSRADSRTVLLAGTLFLNPDLPPGEYWLQCTVIDKASKRSNRAASDLTDFEVD
jgi:VWFA-related protein